MNHVEAALASEKSADQIRTKCSIPTIALNVRVTPLRVLAPSRPLPPALAANPERQDDDKQRDKDEVASPTNEPAEATAAALESPAAAELAAPAVPAGPDNVLRVDAERIDSVLNLVGELILAKSMFQQTLLEFGQRFPKDVLRGKFSDAMAFQARVLNDLQHSVMKIRMVPVDQLFRRFPRIVRDVGRQCGKEVELIDPGRANRSRQKHSGCDRRAPHPHGAQCRRPWH